MTDRLLTRIDANAVRKALRECYNLRHFADPGDSAATVAFLCTDAAGYIHGTTITVDGGATPGIQKEGAS